MQAAVGYPPTVHGIGGQARAFIHIRDTVRCIRLALESRPASGDRVRIMNQMTEVHRVRELAEYVSSLTGAAIEYVDNPRKEAPENELSAEHAELLHLGLTPTTLADALLHEVVEVASRYKDRADLAKIPCTSRW
jgi:UDP-sulfoquinovose synthase